MYTLLTACYNAVVADQKSFWKLDTWRSDTYTYDLFQYPCRRMR